MGELFQMNVVTSGDGKNRDKIIGSEIYVALVTQSFLTNDKCIGEMKDAFALKKPMYAIIQKGTVLPQDFDSYNWKEKYHFESEKDMIRIAKKLKEIMQL